jgi:hypothetical protein
VRRAWGDELALVWSGEDIRSSAYAWWDGIRFTL